MDRSPPRPARLSGRLASLLLAVAAVAAVCPGCAAGFRQEASSVAGLPGSTATVITPLHYWESSRRAVDAWLLGHPEIAQVAVRAAQACVRLEVRVAQSGSSYTEVQGSGFLVGGRFVLTSGHSLAAGPPGAVRVTLADGRGFDARVVASSFGGFASTNVDLAVLELLTDVELPSLEVGRPLAGALAIALGYPGKHGLNAEGLVVSGQAYRDAPLQPLLAVAVVEGSSPVSLRPLAGAIITGGMSGSPVIDSEGRVIGVLNQVASYPDASGVTYTYEAASSLEWAELVARLTQR